MTSQSAKQLTGILMLFSCVSVPAQDPAQDHNSSRSNKTASASLSNEWNFGANGASIFATRKNERNGFRGNSVGSKLFGSYYFGNIGLGFSSGILPGNMSNAALNAFLVERKFQQVQITKSNPFNSFLLFGPSARFGNRVSVNAEIQAGFAINNPGALTIAQPGALRALYQFSAAEKNVFPAFSGNISLAYPITASTNFVINTDYLQTRSSILLLDPQRGVDVSTQQERNVKLMSVGVGITKNFRSAAGNGNAISRHAGTIKSARYHAINTKGTGATNGRIIAASQKHAINTKGTGANNGRLMSTESCGPVTQKTTNPDGTVEEKIFACPADAVDYNARMKVTVPKQTQGATFGEKVNAGLHAAGSALSQGASRGMVSGTVSWGGSNLYGIVTNQAAVSSVSSLAGGAGGGAAAASYARTGAIPVATATKGVVTTIYSREAGSGMATGKRSARDRSGGMATGKRQYTPVFTETENQDCNACAVTAKLIAHQLTHTVQQSQSHAKNNPLYDGNNGQGTNPLFGQKSGMQNSDNNDCDGIEGLTVVLVNAADGSLAATTSTGNCGHFFFANVPAASYLMKLSGAINQTKTYEISVNSESMLDVAGELKTAADHWTILLNTGSAPSAKAGISTSRSNIPRGRRLTVVESDLDGDGSFELTKALMEFTDGVTKDVTANTRISNTASIKKVTVRGWDVEKKQQAVANSNSPTEYSIDFAGNDEQVTISSNTSKTGARAMAEVSLHANVMQWSVSLLGEDAGIAPNTVGNTKQYSYNEERAGENTGDDYSMAQSFTKKLPMLTGDVDGDGIAEILIGNVNNTYVRSGALPGAAMAMPGDPIPGLDVKLGKNPGGSSMQTTSSSNGEFEFTNLKNGSYTLTNTAHYLIEDETLVTVGGKNDEAMFYRKGWDGTIKGGSVVADATTNKGINQAGIKKNASENTGNALERKGWDGTVKGGNVAADAPTNKGINQAGIKKNASENTGSELERKGWDGTVKGGNITADASTKKGITQSGIKKNEAENAGNELERKGWDGTVKGGSKVQDQNSPGPNKTASAPEKGNDDNRKDFLLALDELDILLEADKTTSPKAIAETKEKIRQLRASLGDHDLGTAAVERIFTHLMKSLTTMGTTYDGISNVLKTKHDTAKNSVGNIR